jgi:hypothetical protein
MMGVVNQRDARRRARVLMRGGVPVVLLSVEGRRARVWFPPGRNQLTDTGHKRTVLIVDIVERLGDCADGGKCHHECGTRCFRLDTCEPLSGVFRHDTWPTAILPKPKRDRMRGSTPHAGLLDEIKEPT